METTNLILDMTTDEAAIYDREDGPECDRLIDELGRRALALAAPGQTVEVWHPDGFVALAVER